MERIEKSDESLGDKPVTLDVLLIGSNLWEESASYIIVCSGTEIHYKK